MAKNSERKCWVCERPGGYHGSLARNACTKCCDLQMKLMISLGKEDWCYTQAKRAFRALIRRAKGGK